MPRLSKVFYRTMNGEKKLNCYNVAISKEIVSNTNIKENDQINIYAKDNKIIIEKK